MTERTPLLHYRLSASVNESDQQSPQSGQMEEQHRKSFRHRSSQPGQPKKLSTFFGVVIPTLLSMFSVVVFLRIGVNSSPHFSIYELFLCLCRCRFVVGQCGLYQAFAMFLVAYIIISLTVLSVCAISTNGALDAGGAYYMISRALGPEFGGSIGLMFFLANVCGSALYVLGLVEAVLATFGVPEDGIITSHYQVLPSGYWWSLLYATAIALLCLLVCLVGAHIYAKTAFLIFVVVMVVLLTIFISFFAVTPRVVQLPAEAILNPSRNGTVGPTTANFTGFKLDTLMGNLWADYTNDYTTNKLMTFATVFAVMFNGCTGIMAGSNMSGDLKNPSYSIPRGTITAVIFTYIIYNLLCVLEACSCDRLLLQKDYSFLRDINIWGPFVTIGVYSSTLSAAMSNLIGASRILYALARDDLFGKALSPAKKTSRSGNPWVSVLLSWFLVQLVLFSGKLNTIASIVTIFFLLVYAAVDLACLALEWASAPNFRPTFRYFTWHTCVLGIVGCVVMMFLINPIYASASIAFMLLLLLLIHYLSPTSSWGYISQALIFHQVRKYLLMLDQCGSDHFNQRHQEERPVRAGHIQLGNLSTLPSDPLQSQYDSWLSLVDHLNIKAFVNLTLADSVRHGVQHLLFISGLGGMRPNTLVLGFYDDCVPRDTLIDPMLSSTQSIDLSNHSQDVERHSPRFHFSPLRGTDDKQGPNADGKVLSSQEYVAIIADAMKMSKNVILARYFNDFDRAEALSPQSFSQTKSTVFIDVWPVNLLRPDSCSYVDTCSLFLLQLACILNMVRAWRKATIRLFLCVEEGRSVQGAEQKLGHLLKELRIKAQVYPVQWDQQASLHWQRQGDFKSAESSESSKQEGEEEEYANSFPSNTSRLSDEYLTAVNKLILDQAKPPAAVRFLYLPRPPADTRRYASYLHHLELLTKDLGPTLLIHGVTPVITTDL
ncbi:hypothetical protein WMY93_028980 [Mugilogobius chulae]|uniref:Solute carrier family 12 member 9 n=1 Tax=Mugilogobius chulae TaxID=88201 RepID=A0AAW0N1R3_9GOBI